MNRVSAWVDIGVIVVANLGAGFASFLPPAEEAICAETRSREQ